MADDRTPTGDDPESKADDDEAERERLEKKYGWGRGAVNVGFKRPPKAPAQPERLGKPERQSE